MQSQQGPLESATVKELIVPRLRASGWSDEQVVFEYRLQAQRTMSSGGTVRAIGEGFADIVLEATPGTPSAVVEAKRTYKTATDAIQQAVRYAQQLDVPLAYGCNGTEIIERNLRTGKERKVQEFAAPALAWAEYCAMHGLDHEGAQLVGGPFNRQRRTVSGDVVEPRYYQVCAINRVLAAVTNGQRRILLLMATGTGKTFTAMQIVAKLRAYEQVVHPDHNYRVLYLADRDQLLIQPMTKDFGPAFGNDVLHRVKGKVDTSREIYFASYQALTGDNPTATSAALFEGFRPDFFDLVIVDECHRGSAADDSAWRAVLDYFSSAVQLGLTATPRDDKVQSYEYFGNPMFKYSLKDGISDGYLAPYKVRRVVLSPDAEGWKPADGELDRYERAIPNGTYTTRDFERVVSLLARTRLVAQHLSKTLRRDPTARAIVFCVDTEHANDMRQALIDENPDLVAADPEWVVRIVGIEDERERLLGDFTDPENDSPVVATTSRLLSTGIDVEDLKYVVIFRPVGSSIEFKQIIGRGSRLYPDKGKASFEIIDYVGATSHFADPDFDGYPVDIVVEPVDGDSDPVDEFEDDESDDDQPMVNEPEPPFTPTDPPEPPLPPGPGGDPPSPPPPRNKYYVETGDFTQVGSDALQVPSLVDGHLVLTEYGEFIKAKIHALADDPDTLSTVWSHTPSRSDVLNSLVHDGVDVEELVSVVAEQTGIADIDPLDALFHLAWNMPARTRTERARHARETHAVEMQAMTDTARSILEGLLQRYESYGVTDLESPAVFAVPPLTELGTPLELADEVGGADQLRTQLDLVQEWLYA